MNQLDFTDGQKNEVLKALRACQFCGYRTKKGCLMRKINDMLAKINSQMHEGRYPTEGCIGECATIYEIQPGACVATLYIWDKKFNDSGRVAEWFKEAGADRVLISHTLHYSPNAIAKGQCSDGTREWHVQFYMEGASTYRWES